MDFLLARIVTAGDGHSEDREAGEFLEYHLVPERAPDLTVFNEAEQAKLREVADRIRTMTAKQVSEESHQHIGYRLTDMGDVIPYETVFWGERVPTTQEIEYGLSLPDEDI